MELEKMGDFFDRRLDGYDEHMRTAIEGSREFYPFTARLLPVEEGSRVLDLGCGTGLELEEYYPLCPSARVTGIDLAPGMLAALQKKFADREPTLILGSYFDVPFEENAYDAAVSVESLHHFTQTEKIALYAKVRRALKRDGYLILTDYFAPSDEKEKLYRQTLMELKAAQGLGNEAFYHYDTPLTVAHETEALLKAGFSTVRVMKRWASTCTLKAR